MTAARLPTAVEDEDEDDDDGCGDDGDGITGRDWRSGVGQESPVAVTVASMGSASPKTHLYLAPNGKSGRVRIVSWTWITQEELCFIILSLLSPPSLTGAYQIQSAEFWWFL